MERITYNKTLDTHKSGVQFTLQGFETADKFARRLVLSLMASGDAIDLPMEQLEVVVYTTTPKAIEPSIDSCAVKGNTIVYDMPPIVEEGITELQLKLIETSPDGARCVLGAPKFAVEVVKSNAEDESVKQSTTYTALEDAIARARGVYESRLLRIALDKDCMFCAYYADGTVYESDVLKELFLQGDVLLSKSFAKGGTGVRDNEETDNAMYYSNVAKSASIASKDMEESARSILNEVKLHGVSTAFAVNFETGELVYMSPKYRFTVNAENGNLEIEGQAYTFEQGIGVYANAWFLEQGIDVAELKETSKRHTEEIAEIQEEARLQKERVDALQVTSERFRPIWDVTYIAEEKYHIERPLAVSPNRKYFCRLKQWTGSESFTIELCRMKDASVVAEYTSDHFGFPCVSMDDDFIALCDGDYSDDADPSYLPEVGGSFVDPNYGNQYWFYNWKFFTYTDTSMEEVEVDIVPSWFGSGGTIRIPASYQPIIKDEKGGEHSFWFLTEEWGDVLDDRRNMVRLYRIDKETKVLEMKWEWEDTYDDKGGMKFSFHRDGDEVIVTHLGNAGATIFIERISCIEDVETTVRICEIPVAFAWGIDMKNEKVVTIGTEGVKVYDFAGNLSHTSSVLTTNVEGAAGQRLEDGPTVVDGYLFARGLAIDVPTLEARSQKILYRTIQMTVAQGSGEAPGFRYGLSVYGKDLFAGAYFTNVSIPIFKQSGGVFATQMFIDAKNVSIGGWLNE
ncbi:MAG: hypothetical protein IJB80_05480 [Clostridia bacterium]|nr:hypothetical protein [Clostridia bacterium]